MAYRYNPIGNTERLAENRRANAARYAAELHADIAATMTTANSPAHRSGTIVTGTGPGPRKGQRPGADKGQGEWRTVSQNYRSAASHDGAWSQTVTSQNV